MKCRLCDRPTTAGSGKLCLECTKALHRARARTGTPRRALGAPPTTGEASVTTYAAPNPAPKVILAAPWQRRVAWSAAGLLAIGIVFLAQPGRQSVPEAHGVDHAPTPLAPRAAGETPAAPSVGLTTTAALKASDAPAASPTQEPNAAVGGAKASPSAAGAKTSARTRTTPANASRNSRTPAPANPIANDTTANPSKAPPESETTQLARASVPTSASATDGEQALATGRAECGSEAFLSRFICEQKAYMRYCEDKWDQDPHCMRTTGSSR